MKNILHILTAFILICFAACDGGGGSNPVETGQQGVDTDISVWDAPGEIIKRASNRGQSDYFGYSVSISGDYAVIGAYNENGADDGTENDIGAAYIFERDGSGNWNETALLRDPVLQAGDQFGYSVSISGDYAVISAYNDDGADDGTEDGCGAAYIFERDGSGNWNRTALLRASNLQANDRFGKSVSISGNYTVIGAYYEDGADDGTEDLCGAAYIFERDGSGNWNETAILRASNLQAGDRFGISVSVSGNYAVIGAPYEDGADNHTEDGIGAAYVFERDSGGNWNQAGLLRASDAQPSDNFGYSVSINGIYVIIGAYNEDGADDGTEDQSGAVYIFERDNGGTWNEAARLRASDAQAADNFGNSVSISGDYAVVGAYHEDGGSGDPVSNSGAVYIFERDSGGSWSERTILRASDAQQNDSLGDTVSISGEYIISGAHFEDGGPGDPSANSGAVYIFH